MKTRNTARMPQGARRSRKLTGSAIMIWAALFAVVIGLSLVKNHFEGSVTEGKVASNQAGRKLMSNGGPGDWNPVHTEQRYSGPLGAVGIVVWVPLTIWIFSGVAIAADEYFQPALESISDALDLSADVRGATFLAAASSAPEFFTSFADTFLVSEEGGEGFGVGTIVGSAVFNVLIIVALSTIPTMFQADELKANEPQEPETTDLSEEAKERATRDFTKRHKAWENKMQKLEEEGAYLPIDWYPLSRDCIFYSLSIVILVVSVSTNEPSRLDKKPHIIEGCVTWYESLIYIILYALYIAFMYKSADFRDTAEKIKEQLLETCPCLRDAPEEHKMKDLAEGNEGPLDVQKAAADLKAKEEVEGASELSEMEEEDDDDEEAGGLFDNLLGFDDKWSEPLGACCNIAGIITVPFKILFRLTIPNVSRPAMQNHYIISFFMCILWIGFLSTMMVKVVSWIGAAIQLHPVIMGLVVLAAGTSVPDALGSYNEAKHGNADAAVSNALGSNVFDICVGLGVPWFIFALVKSRCYAVPKEEILIPTLILFFVLFMFIGTLAVFKMRLYAKVGFVYLCVYVIFVVWVLINGVFLKVKL
eukprot:TRINITY_DN33797_c0_g1_i1.p1 TRINITY_DN33797_c0_g1~~TRINITY_DN33797_c0_g1_i1.p1  ORF type:complete len:590 (+),score=129.78 TRINITY_DN33797_c0_g1_i1:46-1815(+)